MTLPPDNRIERPDADAVAETSSKSVAALIAATTAAAMSAVVSDGKISIGIVPGVAPVAPLINNGAVVPAPLAPKLALVASVNATCSPEIAVSNPAPTNADEIARIKPDGVTVSSTVMAIFPAATPWLPNNSVAGGLPA